MSVTDELQEALAPWMTPDYSFLANAVGSMFAEVEAFASPSEGGDGTDGWYVMFDVDLAPFAGLPWLAQVAGERLPTGISDAAARQWITDGPNSRRGTPLAIARAAQRHLELPGVVILVERSMPDGSEDPMGDHFTVYTYADQTPNPAQTLADLLTTVPGDMVLNYVTLTGINWALLEDPSGTPQTWNQIQAGGKTWSQIESQVAAGTTYVR
jgi:hypothetical protein